MIDRLKRRKFGQNYLVDPIIINKIATIVKSNTQKGMFEIGPGKVLTGMVKRTIKSPNCFSINTIADITDLNDKFKR